MPHRSVLAALAGALLVATLQARAAPPQPAADAQAHAHGHAPRASHPARHAKPPLDLSGRTRVGKASYYAPKFKGRKMADGSRMDPQGNGAASKTLPLGTTAKVTNLETGQSAVVTIRDRGPHVPGRIVDLSPATARQVGIGHHDGVSKVAVTPLSLPASAADQARARAAQAHGRPAPARRETASTSTAR